MGLVDVVRSLHSGNGSSFADRREKLVHEELGLDQMSVSLGKERLTSEGAHAMHRVAAKPRVCSMQLSIVFIPEIRFQMGRWTYKA